MRYRTTSYPLDCPRPVWRALTEVQSTENNLNDEVTLAISKHVDDLAEDGDLEEEQAAAIREVLGDERGR